MSATLVDIQSIKTAKVYSLGEYLSREEWALHKHEFYNGAIIRKPSRGYSYNKLVGNIFSALHTSVRTVPDKYHAVNSGQKIKANS